MPLRTHKFLIILVLGLLIGCAEVSKKPSPPERPFLMMSSTTLEIPRVVFTLTQAMKDSPKPRQALIQSMDEIYSPKFRSALFFPLLDALKKRKTQRWLVRHYLDEYPQDIPHGFLERLQKTSGDQFLDLLELYLGSGRLEGLSLLERRLSQRKSVLARELLLHGEILLRLGYLDHAYQKLELNFSRFPEKYHKKLLFLTGQLAFYQGRFSACTRRFKELFNDDKYKGMVVEALVDAFLFQGITREAFRFSKIFSDQEFENPKAHLLRSKIYLLSNHPREARKEWLRAKSLGAFGERFHLQSFLLAHYFPHLVGNKDLGPFLDWKTGQRVAFPHRDALALYRQEYFRREYAKLHQKDAKRFPTLVLAPGVSKMKG
jgi:hypothetical protein